jgi:hypothetical protein
MVSFPCQLVHGHVIVSVAGAPCVLDTGAPFSVGYAPLCIGNRVFDVQESYLNVCPEWLSEHVGLPVAGSIGADVLAQYTVCLQTENRRIEFTCFPPQGELLLPLNNFMDIPIIPVQLNGRVLRVFFDTGAPMSLLPGECLHGLQPVARQEEYYPLLGHFMTNVYELSMGIGGDECRLRFGELPEELRGTLQAGQVQGIVGTELLRRFDLCYSLNDGVMRLDKLPDPRVPVQAHLTTERVFTAWD